MSEVDKTTAEPTVNDVQEAQDTTLNAEQTEKPDTTENTEQPLSEILQGQEEKESEKPEVDFKDLFKKERKDKRQLEARLKQLEKSIEDGASEDDISDDIEELADEFNVDKTFLKKLERSVEKKFESRLEERLNSKLKPLEEKDKQAQFVSTVSTYFNNALERMPEFKGVANLNTILQLASVPSNKNKTVSQLIEETYSSSLTGKKTIESSTVRGTTEPKEVDFNRAKSDTEYFKQVMADPELKKKYNDGLARRVLR